MQSLIWKPGISVSTASLGNCGVIDTLNSFDQLEATDSGWEYQPLRARGFEEASKAKAPGAEMYQLRALFAVHLAFVLWFVPTGRPLSRRSSVAHRCDGRQQSTVNS